MRYLVGLCLAFAVNLAHAQAPVIFQDGTAQDQRLGDLKTLNGFFPFRPVGDLAAWKLRQRDIKRRVLVSQG